MATRTAPLLTLAILAAATLGAAAQTAPPEITARARTAMEGAFARTDANGDGRISPEEAEHMPAIAAMFARLDANRDGYLSLEEFAAGYFAAA
jgi:Ca2+-binding EF-hand superfamily protein